MKDLNFYIKLGHAAIPYNDDECGTDQQINAINLFYNEIEALLPDDKFKEYAFYLKATDTETITYGLELIAEQLLYHTHYTFLIDTYNTFITANELPALSVDELLHYKNITTSQKKWLEWYLVRWELFT